MEIALERSKSLFTLYQAFDFQPGPSGAPAIQALDHADRLQKSRKRVTGVGQRVGKQTVATPLSHLTDKWRKHVILGDKIAPNQYEAAAFESLNARLHSGDVAVGESCWNAVYLSQAVEELKKRGEVVPEEYLPHITPLGWEHINLIGQYSFTHQSARSLDNLRPLRLPEQEAQAEEERVTAERA